MKLPETIRAAFVIARRDYGATVFSKTFLFFLLGPLFPIALGMGFGGIGKQVEQNVKPAAVAVIGAQSDYELLKDSRARLMPMAGDNPLIDVRHVEPAPDLEKQRQDLLNTPDKPVLGVLDGGIVARRCLRCGTPNCSARTT